MPHLQMAKHRVGAGDQLVAVGVNLSQHVHAPHVHLDARIAEQLVPGVDAAVAIAVQHQHAVARADPVGLLGKAVVVHVEQHRAAGRLVAGTNAIRPQVQHDRPHGLGGIGVGRRQRAVQLGPLQGGQAGLG
ncbi:MAG: hypothetical protein IPO43_10605 [Rhodoferax sp.]|nr:hypothetical protein [Rhodoferax sp.]